MNIKVAIILAKGNQAVSEKMLKNVQVSLYKEGILEKDITLIEVPGVLELPRYAKILSDLGKFEVIICLGILLKHGSPMFEPMGQSLIHQLLDISTNCKTPLINEIIMSYELDEAMKMADSYAIKKIGKWLLDIKNLERNIKEIV